MKPGLLTIAALFVPGGAEAGDSWPRRFGGPQGTTDAGDVAELTPATVTDLLAVKSYSLGGNATPVVGFGLLFYGGSSGISVIDVASGKTLIHEGTQKFESTGTLAVVTIPDSAGGTREENRYYVGGNSQTATMECLNVDAILADRATLQNDPGTAYLCDGPERPLYGCTGTARFGLRFTVPGRRGESPSLSVMSHRPFIRAIRTSAAHCRERAFFRARVPCHERA